MSKEGSIAPKERVNIMYRPATGDVEESVEIPMKSLVIGEFMSHEDPTPLVDRKAININKDNFNNVIKEQNLSLALNVPNKLDGEEDSELAINIEFKSLSAFTPDEIVKQVPELSKMIELRDALKTVRSQLGNVPDFKKKIASIIQDPETRAQLLEELNLTSEK
jgi:type VI secretion system protein ImpB